MLVIKIELWPGGDESRKRLLHEGRIWRHATLGPYGNYRYTFSQANKTKRLLREGGIEGFPRKRLSAWDLLFRCLKEAFGERNQNSSNGKM